MCICDNLQHIKTCVLCGKGLPQLQQDIADYFSPDEIAQYQRYQNRRVFVRRTSVSIGQKLGIGGQS